MHIFGYVIEISKRLEKADVYFGHGTDNSIDEAAYIICGSLNISYDCDLRSLDYHLSPRDIKFLELRLKSSLTKYFELVFKNLSNYPFNSRQYCCFLLRVVTVPFDHLK